MEIVLGSKRITLEDLINVTRRGYKVKISDEAYEKIDKARALLINMLMKQEYLTELQLDLENLQK